MHSFATQRKYNTTHYIYVGVGLFKSMRPIRDGIGKPGQYHR